MASDVEVQNAPAIVADDEEAVQNPKGESGNGEEIHGRDSFAMIAQKGQPALRGLRVLGRPFHPAGNGSFRHVEAEHQEFAMDARRTPTGIVSDHLKDQFTDLLGDPAATAHWIPHFAEHGPVPVSYTHLRAHETDSYLVCRLLLEKKKTKNKNY